MDVEIRTLEPQRTVVVRAQLSKERIGEAFMTNLPKVYEFVMSAGGKPGHPFGRYFDMSGEQVDFEIGLPVAEPLATQGDIQQSEIPGGRHAVTVHKGSYETLPSTYSALFEWLAANGHTAGGAPFESYIDDPGSIAPDQLRTEVYVPLA